MQNLFKGFIGRVYRIRIEGAIDEALSHSITKGLTSTWPYKPVALLVSINSQGGSLTQAQNIADLLKQQSNLHNIPIVAFAEDACLGSANLILTSGVKCYANSFSMIGDLGFLWSRMWYNKFAQKYNISQESISAGQNPIKFDQFKDLTPEAEKWIKNYSYHIEHTLKVGILANRGEQFLKNKLNKEGIDQKIFNAGIIDPTEAVKLGFLDGLKNIDEQIADRFSSVPIREINKKNNLAEKIQGHDML